MLLASQHYRETSTDIGFVAVDMPPTALNMKFFKLPSFSLRWLDHLLDLRQEARRICAGLEELRLEDRVHPILNRGTNGGADLPLFCKPLIGASALGDFLSIHRDRFHFLATP